MAEFKTSDFRSYEEFWPFYVSQHSHPVSRRLHFFGTALVLVVFVLSLVLTPWLLFAMPVCGYFFAWLGHFGFEKNRPATFKYPFWSLRADFRMFWWTIIGRMPGEVEKYTQKAA